MSSEVGKKKRASGGNTGPLTQPLHYIDTALQLLQPLVLGQTYKSTEDSSQDTTSYICAFFCLPDITSLTVSSTGNNQIPMVADAWE